MSILFISHSSKDNAQAIALSQWLTSSGWPDQFLDLDPERGIVGGERWEEALHQAASRCDAVLFLISQNWLSSPWCRKEFALAQKLGKQIFGVLIDETPIADVPSECTSTWQLVDLHSGADHGQAREVILPNGDKAFVYFSETGLRRLKAGLAKSGFDPQFFLWPPANEPNRAPYRGLLPMEAEDAGIFFGREASLIELLVALRTLREAAPPRFISILGASGAGKSSFLRAGVLPRLQRDERHFYPLPIVRPNQAVMSGRDGLINCLLKALTQEQLTEPLGISRAQIRAAVEGGSATVLPLLNELTEKVTLPLLSGESVASVPTLVLPLDQAEELFTCEGKDEARQFLQLLRELLTVSTANILVVATIRSDAYELLQTAKPLEGIRQHTASLPPLPSGAYQQVIEGPAQLLASSGRKLFIEPQLTRQLLEDLDKGGAKDALPLLAFTLERLYPEYGGDGDLKLNEYCEMGGIQGAIEQAVESAIQAAMRDPNVPSNKDECLKLLRRGLIPWLAGIDPATQQPRRRVAKLHEIPEEARTLICYFVEMRLLATDQNEDGETTIEPAHESLLRQWQRLRGWLNENAAALAILENLKAACRDWEASARDASWLTHSQGRLDYAETLLNRKEFKGYASKNEREYLAQCRAAQEGGQLYEDEQKNKALEESKKLAAAQNHLVKRTRLGLYSALCLVAIVTLMAIWAIKNDLQTQNHLAKAHTVLERVRSRLYLLDYDINELLEGHVPENERQPIIQHLNEVTQVIEAYKPADNDKQKKVSALIDKAKIILQSDQGNLQEALRYVTQAKKRFTEIVEQNPADSQAQKDLKLSQSMISEIQVRLSLTDAQPTASENANAD